MTERLRAALEGSPISWSTLVAVILAITGGIYGYGQLNQRVNALEELRPTFVAGKLAAIEANQQRTANDLSRIQSDIADIRREIVRQR